MNRLQYLKCVEIKIYTKLSSKHSYIYKYIIIFVKTDNDPFTERFKTNRHMYLQYYFVFYYR